MTANTKGAGVRLFSIRNLLFAVTAALTLSVVVLSVFQVLEASNSKNRAERAAVLNELIDNLTQFKLALAGERLYAGTAYGFEEVVTEDFTRGILINRSTVENSFDLIRDGLNALPPFDSEGIEPDRYEAVVQVFNGQKQQFFQRYQSYQENLDLVDEDMESYGNGTGEGAPDKLRGSQVRRSINGLVDAAAAIRTQLEASYDFGDDRIGTVNRLKTQLWIMFEYASRTAAELGEVVASVSEIDGGLIGSIERNGGRTQAAWDQVLSFANSATATPQMAAQLDEISEKFIDGLASEQYTLVDENDIDEDEELEYSYSALEWVELARDASTPVDMMTSYANTLATDLNSGAVASANTSVTIAWGLITLSLGIGGLAIWIVWVRVVKPVNALSATMMVLADGNLEVDIPNADREDEMGDMAKSVQIFKDNAVERRRLEAEQREAEERERERREEEERRQREEAEERRVREEEQAEQARSDRRQAMLELADQFEASVMALVEGVSTSASGMEQAASSLTDTAADTSQQSEVVANAAQQASSNAQMVASAAEELSASVREITGQTNQSSAAARDAVSRTENAGKDVAELVDAAEKIGEVVKLINEIAEQTNLLALNATIEAARAGDAGKGFAVVASEVKSLANQTAKATQEISEQVTGMQNATGLAVRAMDEIKGIIGDIESTSVSIASAVEEQDASTQEIARNVGEVSTGTEEVTSNIHRVNEGATTTGSAATQVLSAAQLLTQQSGELRGQVEDFLKTIRA